MFLKSNKLAFFSLVIILIIGALYIWFGAFNVAANNKHWGITTSFLETVRQRSVSIRSQNIIVPNLSSSERIAKGVPNYAAMCAQCHLAPGVDKSELYEGLYPQPPVFYKTDNSTHKPEETFWIIKNGLKMTGMPAWGIYNSDEQIWDMVAVLSKLKDMTPEQYKKLADAGEHTHAKGGHDEDGHKDSLMTKPMDTQKKNHTHNGGEHKH